MHIIKVDAIDSTNTFLKDLNREKNLVTSVCVTANEQKAGKGQMGTVWQSNYAENLTCSVFIPVEGLKLEDQFFVSIVTSLAICDTLKNLLIPKISIKWPNDILSDRLKICGVLIENLVKNGRLSGAIIGIGLNINQIKFDNLPQAGSLKLVSGQNFNIEEVLNLLLKNIENGFSKLNPLNFKYLRDEYHSLLFRKNKPSTFLDTEGNSFVGIIQAITNEGKLQVLLEDEILEDYDLKEIKLLY
ncbi:biotin--[acetyl-CoA-carboxylase] ligase [Aquimarina sp. MMG016]|uniref:biotin--[acetyl-CoA-carboxylase] ligase n=1 Tax=Aquimarina sp. MMG016 TaxID=2822690 RepID=UPI001B3A415A|nr:biotin--[acetyl-CoA-carboxylase] ligase [Aquimarina sp. MMG016]MBQ4820471.1 biotin--[acetyl-CoA-carboxylase] ligase [Aquimarina sp. MMG016]